MKLKFISIFIIAIAFSFTLLSGEKAYAGEIRYVGSSTVGKFIRDAQAVYKKSTFKMNTKPESGGGEKCPLAGTCEIGGVARDVNKDILAQGVVATTIGKDAIAAIVNPGNSVSSLSLAQLNDIFTGKVTNWKDVGGSDMPIKVFITDKNSATNKVFKKVVLQGKEYKAKIVRPDAKIVRLVSSQKGAIGQISFAFIMGNDKVKPIKPNGQEASVSNSNYPITRPLNIVTKGQPSGAAKDFIDWTLSSEGQKVIKKKFVSVR